MKEEVLAFIKHFQNEGTIKTFTEGCCYWFAVILGTRYFKQFDNIWYNPVDNHFAAMIRGHLYDITGEVERTEDWVAWWDYMANEPSDAERVFKNCALKID